jgi:hypothetical protein
MNLDRVSSYQSLYVAACGELFPNHELGISHEKECPHCKCVIRENDNIQEEEIF